MSGKFNKFFPPAGYQFGSERHNVYALQAGLETWAVVTKDKVTFGNARDHDIYPHIERALKRLADLMPTISGAGMTHRNQSELHKGLLVLLHIVPAKGFDFEAMVDLVDEASDFGQPLTQDQVSAVIIWAVPITCLTTGQDLIDYARRRGHVARVLDQMGMLNPATNPYPILRVPFEIRGNPWTGTAYDIWPLSNDMIWRHAAFACSMFNGKASALVIRPFKGWDVSSELIAVITAGQAARYTQSDADI